MEAVLPTSTPPARPVPESLRRAVVAVALSPLASLLLATVVLARLAPATFAYPAALLAGTTLLLYLAYGRYTDPGRRPAPAGAALSVVTVVCDEAATVAARLGALTAAHPTAEIIVVDNGSRDGSAEALRRLALYGQVTVLRLATPVAAHDAARHGAAYATGDLLAFLAAGAVLAPDALPRCAAALAADPQLGAVVAHTRARHADTNLLTRAQDAWLDSRFRVTVAAEAAVGALTDAPAGVWVCRREAVYPHLPAWKPGRSLGALVRGQGRDGARWRRRHADSPFVGQAARPDRGWRVGYVASARVYVPVPGDIGGFLAAQGRRWGRAVPALAAALRYAGAGGAAFTYVHAAARLVGPVAAAWCLVGAPATGAWAATVAYLAAVGVAGLAQGIAAAVERPHVPGWAYQPVSRLSGALLHPLVPAYALLHAVRARRAATETR